MSARTITVFSTKGGVGKTFITVNLATALALAKKKVLLIDLDFQAGQDMSRMLNIAPRKAIVDLFSLSEEEASKPLSESATRHKSGLDFIPAVKNTRQIAHLTPENIKPFLRSAMQEYEYILIDAGKTFSEIVVTILDSSNLVLLAATPDILAVYQIKWCLDVLQSLQFPAKMVKMILNRSESRGSVAWQEVRSALTCEIFGHVPSDGKTVGLALNRGIPCVIDNPQAGVSDAFIKMAGLLQKENCYVLASELNRQQGEAGEQKNKFWEKFGISQQLIKSTDEHYVTAEQEVVALKKKIHERLVERLNLDGITPDALSDPQSALRIKKKAESVVTDLLMEEAGGKLASHEDRIMFVRDVVNEALGLGPLEDFLADVDVTDIMVNSKDAIYVEKNGKLILTNKKFISDNKMRSVIDRIVAPLGRRVDESTPMVDARLPDGSRINAILPPLSLTGPMITIRKFGKERLTSKELLEKFGSLTPQMANFLRACVHGRRNIIVSGGTGAGKTTLLNVISEFIPEGERIITIEDAAELKIKQAHWGRLESRPPNIEGRGQITIRDLFINSLRMRPDRIIIGECRGPEVLDMLQAMNTGHDGSMTTLHANSTRDVVTRMHSMILLSGIELPVRAINEMISSAIQIIVHISRFPDGTRKITGIAETAGLDQDFQLKLSDIFVFKQEGINSDGVVLGTYHASGIVPHCYEDLVMRGIPLEKDIFTS